MTEKGIQEGQTQEMRDAYLCGYADGALRRPHCDH